MPTSCALLEELLAFETVSLAPNLALIEAMAAKLRPCGAKIDIVPSPDGERANLFATIGPSDRPGVMLSGHTDVVPVAGQNWTVPPFALTEKDGRLYGRGTADMKSFVACAVAAAIRASSCTLAIPLHIALSYDEEIGCIGVRHLIDVLGQAPFQPRFAIIGEPTELQVASGHKGKIAAQAVCHGREGHSALAPLGMNAIHLAAEFVEALRRQQATLADTGVRDDDYDIAYTTVHVGTIEGGGALNIVPNRCELSFEIRHLAEDDPEAILADLRTAADGIVNGANDPDARIDFDIRNRYPGLATPIDSDAIRLVQSLTGANTTRKVAFGTEAGLFDQDLGVPCVICGPGSMAQGHKPDEYITIDQLERCEAMLDRLIERLQSGL